MENKITKIKERILLYAQYKGIAYEKFTESIGMTYGNFKGSAKERPINSDALDNILSNYPDINPLWLISGVGSMLLDENRLDNHSNISYIPSSRKTTDNIYNDQEIPLYNLEATAGLKQLFDSGGPREVLDTIKIPNLPKCDGAITVSGDSMYPLLKSGDIVLYRQTTVENIFFGEMYLLSVKLDEWEEYITVKYVQRSELGQDYVKLVSQNSHHQSKDILVNKITALALVKASIRINTML